VKKNSAINILFVINDARQVSHSSHLLRLITYLSRKKFVPTVYLLSPNGELLKTFLNLPHVRVIYSRGSLFDNVKKIRSLIEKGSISLVCTKELRSEYLLHLIKLCCQKKFIHITIRPSFGFPFTNIWNIIKNVFYVYSCYMVDQNIGVAKHVAESIKRFPFINPKKIIAIPNSVPLLKNGEMELHTLPVIIFTGRLVPEKGIWTLIKALEKIKPEFKCMILGKGTEEKRIIAYLSGKKLQDKIRLVGFQKDCYPYLKQADIFISLSKHTEGLPLSLLEAMNMGCACLVSNIPGHSDIISNNKNGILVNANNQPEIVNSIIRLLENVETRRALGRCAKKTIAAKYSDAIVFPTYLSIFQDLGNRAYVRSHSL
jgi:glycosyltransferase involved in cell wall biosynthesis